MAKRRGPGRPFKPGEGGRPKGIPNKATRDIKAFSRNFLESPAYIASLQQRILAGDAPQVEQLLFHYGYGKPKDTVAVEGGPLPLPLVVKLTTSE